MLHIVVITSHNAYIHVIHGLMQQADVHCTWAVKHSASGCLCSQSAFQIFLPLSRRKFCMKSDSRMWVQIGTKR